MSLEDTINRIKKAYGVDLDGVNAKFFVEGLINKISSNDKEDSNNELKTAGNEVFYNMAKNTYGPLMTSYVDWLLKSYTDTGKKGNVAFLARDAILLYNIAHTLAEETEIIDPERLKLVYLTRKICGLGDEISGFKAEEEKMKQKMNLVKEYFDQEGIVNDSLVVDMGVYGSIYNKLAREEIWTPDKNIHMAFLYSKNPDIMGYLNLLFEDMGDDMKNLCNILIDCGECVNPQLHLTPGELNRVNGKLKPDLVKNGNGYIESWYHATIKGYIDAAKEYITNPVDPLEEMKKLQDMIEKAKGGDWNGTLPHTTPEWSLKEDFLKNTEKYRLKEKTEGWIGKPTNPLNTKNLGVYVKNAIVE